jgi:hypothetical protein
MPFFHGDKDASFQLAPDFDPEDLSGLDFLDL